ncbi:Pterin-4-alpha-carbinolamine dehydratase [Actinidia chinensis var. chinensis]|uniref:4a-hydroxytetrahydrobiopterin dehydratase n=1 Tax=Actinidia chinensis var. chinensis TaxID=1590841 RepID=A0A2R6RTC2_ACTCC|nr:Pterin-4-alpha-carbinolamine dehydratase [Actinidia chinensis var. chinensis]
MAVASHRCFFSHPLHHSSLPSTPPTPSLLLTPQGRASLKIRASVVDVLGDFGARDPFPAEIASGFAEKVLGNVDTEHRILIPNLSALSLAQQNYTPLSPLQRPILKEDAQKLLRKLVGWRLMDEPEGLKLQCLWKVRDFKCGVELIRRISNVVEVTGHCPNLHLENPNQVSAELWTASIGGLSI